MKHLTRRLIQGLIVVSSCVAFAEGEFDKYSETGTSTSAPDVTTSIKNAPEPPSEASGNPIPGLDERILHDMNTLANLLEQAKAVNSAGKVRQERQNLSEYHSLRETCADREVTTEMICREKTNPAIVEALPIIQAVMTGVAGAKDACSGFAKATDVLNKALVAYQVTCAATKTLCQSACGKAGSLLKNAKENITKAINLDNAILQTPENKAALGGIQRLQKNVNDGIDKELGNDKDAVASNLKTCTGYDKQIASAVIGAVGVLRSMSQSKDCGKKLEATTPTPGPGVSPTPDCGISANQTLTFCVCQLNPRAVGCGTGLNSPNAAKSFNPLAPMEMSSASTAKDKDPTLVSGGPEKTDPAAKSAGTGPGGAGAPTGGGSAMDGGGSGQGGGPAAGGKAGSRLNANILGGEGGGGGGGGGWGGGGDGGDPALRQYLPGGGKDPTNLAGKAVAKEVTSPGGKSNWEKVRERYRDNKPTLLGY